MLLKVPEEKIVYSKEPENSMEFPFEYTEEEIGGFSSVHIYIARKLTNP